MGRGRLTRWGQCVGLLSCSALFHEMIQASAYMLLYAFTPIAFASKDKLWKPLLTYHENKNDTSHTLLSCVTFSTVSLGSVREHIDGEDIEKYSLFFVFVWKRRKKTDRLIFCHPKIPLMLNSEALEHIRLMKRFIMPARVCDSTVSMKYWPVVSSRPNS